MFYLVVLDDFLKNFFKIEIIVILCKFFSNVIVMY